MGETAVAVLCIIVPLLSCLYVTVRLSRNARRMSEQLGGRYKMASWIAPFALLLFVITIALLQLVPREAVEQDRGPAAMAGGLAIFGSLGFLVVSLVVSGLLNAFLATKVKEAVEETEVGL